MDILGPVPQYLLALLCIRIRIEWLGLLPVLPPILPSAERLQ